MSTCRPRVGNTSPTKQGTVMEVVIIVKELGNFSETFVGKSS